MPASSPTRPPAGTFNAAAFAVAAVRDSAQTDSLMEAIERRVTAIEEAIATGRLADPTPTLHMTLGARNEPSGRAGGSRARPS